MNKSFVPLQLVTTRFTPLLVGGQTMTDEQVGIARELVKCPSFEWVQGMLAVHDIEGASTHLKPLLRIGAARDVWTAQQFGCIPDLTDWGTAGALMSLLTPGQWVIFSGTDEYQLELNMEAGLRSLTAPVLGQALAMALL